MDAAGLALAVFTLGVQITKSLRDFEEARHSSNWTRSRIDSIRLLAKTLHKNIREVHKMEEDFNCHSLLPLALVEEADRLISCAREASEEVMAFHQKYKKSKRRKAWVWVSKMWGDDKLLDNDYVLEDCGRWLNIILLTVTLYPRRRLQELGLKDWAADPHLSLDDRRLKAQLFQELQTAEVRKEQRSRIYTMDILHKHNVNISRLSGYASIVLDELCTFRYAGVRSTTPLSELRLSPLAVRRPRHHRGKTDSRDQETYATGSSGTTQTWQNQVNFEAAWTPQTHGHRGQDVPPRGASPLVGQENSPYVGGYGIVEEPANDHPGPSHRPLRADAPKWDRPESRAPSSTGQTQQSTGGSHARMEYVTEPTGTPLRTQPVSRDAEFGCPVLSHEQRGILQLPTDSGVDVPLPAETFSTIADSGYGGSLLSNRRMSLDRKGYRGKDHATDGRLSHSRRPSDDRGSGRRHSQSPSRGRPRSHDHEMNTGDSRPQILNKRSHYDREPRREDHRPQSSSRRPSRDERSSTGDYQSTSREGRHEARHERSQSQSRTERPRRDEKSSARDYQRTSREGRHEGSRSSDRNERPNRDRKRRNSESQDRSPSEEELRRIIANKPRRRSSQQDASGARRRPEHVDRDDDGYYPPSARRHRRY